MINVYHSLLSNILNSAPLHTHTHTHTHTHIHSHAYNIMWYLYSQTSVHTCKLISLSTGVPEQTPRWLPLATCTIGLGLVVEVKHSSTLYDVYQPIVHFQVILYSHTHIQRSTPNAILHTNS